jgi:hypothetical protein
MLRVGPDLDPDNRGCASLQPCLSGMEVQRF